MAQPPKGHENHSVDKASLTLSLAVALFGLIGVGIGAILTNRSQHRHWLRERKIEAISAFVEDTSLMVDRFRGSTETPADLRAEWLHAIQSGRTTIHLLCAKPTREAAEELALLAKAIETDKSTEAMKRAITALTDFVALAREEINPSRRWRLIT